ncbi:MAG: hypothetical protein V4773_04895 [Verrucomicrobiota bacterium]
MYKRFLSLFIALGAVASAQVAIPWEDVTKPVAVSSIGTLTPATNKIPYYIDGTTAGLVTIGGNLSLSGGTLNLSATPNIGTATGVGVNLSGNGAFGGNVTATGNITAGGTLTVSGVGASNFTGAITLASIFTSTSIADEIIAGIQVSTGAKTIRLANTGGNAWFGIQNAAGDFLFGVPSNNTAIASPSNPVYIRSTSTTVSGNFTVVGTLATVGPSTGANKIAVQGAAGQPRAVYLTTGAYNDGTGAGRRWGIIADTTVEGGANAGSNFSITAYDDAGAPLSPVPLAITRSTSAVVIGGTGTIKGVRTFAKIAHDFTSIAAQTVGTTTVTVTGAVVGDTVAVAPPATLNDGLICTGRVSATNTVTLTLANITSGAIDPASLDYKGTVISH